MLKKIIDLPEISTINSVSNAVIFFNFIVQYKSLIEKQSYDDVVQLLKKCIKLFDEKKIVYKKIVILRLLAQISLKNEHYEDTLTFCFEAIEMYNALGAGFYAKSFKHIAAKILTTKKMICNNVKLCYYIGQFFLDKGEYPSAHLLFRHALKEAKMKSDIQLQILILRGLQKYTYYLSNYDAVIQYGNEGISLANSNKDSDVIVAFKINIGAAYVGLEKYKKAAEIFDESAILLENQKERIMWLFNAYMNAGIAYSNIDDFKTSKDRFSKAKKMLQSIKSPYSENLLNLNIVVSLIKQNRLEEAQKIIETIEQFYRAEKDTLNIINTLKNKVIIYEKKKQYKIAFDIMKEINDLQKKMFSEENIKRVVQLKNDFEYEQKEREKKILLKQNKKLELKNLQLQKAQDEIRKLEQKNSIFAMAVTTSHEINQPLTCIQGNLELLVAKNEDEKLKKYITRLESSIEDINAILEKYRNQTTFRFVHYTDETMMVSFEDE